LLKQSWGACDLCTISCSAARITERKPVSRSVGVTAPQMPS